MNVWYPVPGQPGCYLCHRHPQVVATFRPAQAQTCPECVADPPPVEENNGHGSQVPQAPEGTPSAVHHELAHLARLGRLERSISKLLTFGDRRLDECNRLIKEAGQQKRAKTGGLPKKAATLMRDSQSELERAISAYNSAAKLEAEATKKRRAATELTRWREDWANTEKLESELQKLREMHH